MEGADLTGKTTLANTLADEVRKDGGDTRVIHAGRPTRHPLEEYETSLVGYDPRGNGLTVLDRWHVGEHVWPSVFGRESSLDLAVARHVELFMLSRGASLVYAERSSYKLRRELEAATDEPRYDLHEALGLFEKALRFRGDPIGSWDYERDGSAQVDAIITSAILTARDVAPIWEYTSQWIGTPYPKVLLVGDRFGPLRPGANAPAVPFSAYPGTSGHYLLSALPTTLWRHVAIVNAFEQDGDCARPQALPEVRWALGGPPVVALGAAADRELHRQGIPHRKVPHPQFWRRFRHHERAAYARVIAQAA